MMRGGLCETCLSPGACCTDLFLSSVHGNSEVDSPMSFDRAEHWAMRERLPFRPLAQNPDGKWRWWCTALTPEGRCSVYEDRPALCRSYSAGKDGLCVHHAGTVPL